MDGAKNGAGMNYGTFSMTFYWQRGFSCPFEWLEKAMFKALNLRNEEVRKHLNP
jgi:hypothetical protein